MYYLNVRERINMSKTKRILKWPYGKGNWKRWDNDLGTTNLITPDKVKKAACHIKYGIVIQCSRPLSSYSPLQEENTYSHTILSASKSRAGGNVQASSDRVTINIHGMVNTHMDALCHVGFNNKGFNGIPFKDMVNLQDGGIRGAITNAVGLVTRGLLVDVPRLRQIEYLKPGDYVREEELETAAQDLEPGDALLVRTGHWLTPSDAAKDQSVDPHGKHSGFHPDCMEFIAKKDVSLLGSDGPNDCFPSPISECPLPIHVLSLTYYGIHLIHNMDLENLATICYQKQQYSFMFCVAPLNIPGGTGSPLTPLAIM
jgi:kynurenine formamidase